uniref:Uncharacterized protein n=1 Tax=Podospora anserina (strain S / ATCC MYA-4624 / DSM 980 / FGSC 10383) TaxID=515849 RepID=A0A090CBX6_PODAN|nr:Putative protein of unknown function [Podospora anserina S mat+]
MEREREWDYQHHHHTPQLSIPAPQNNPHHRFLLPTTHHGLLRPHPSPRRSPHPLPQIPRHPPLQHHLQLLAAFSSIAALLILRRQTKLSLSSPLTHPPPPVWQKALFYSATYLSFSGLAHDYTGKSIYKRTNDRLDSLFSSSSSSQSSNSIFNPLPEQAQRTKQLIKEERERRRLAEGKPPTEAKEEEEKKGVITKIWMGGEKDGWQERRMEEEKKALEEGKGYGDLIMEQIYEVFGWGGKKDDEKKEKPEEKKND